MWIYKIYIGDCGIFVTCRGIVGDMETTTPDSQAQGRTPRKHGLTSTAYPDYKPRQQRMNQVYQPVMNAGMIPPVGQYVPLSVMARPPAGPRPMVAVGGRVLGQTSSYNSMDSIDHVVLDKRQIFGVDGTYKVRPERTMARPGEGQVAQQAGGGQHHHRHKGDGALKKKGRYNGSKKNAAKNAVNAGAINKRGQRVNRKQKDIVRASMPFQDGDSRDSGREIRKADEEERGDDIDDEGLRGLPNVFHLGGTVHLDRNEVGSRYPNMVVPDSFVRASRLLCSAEIPALQNVGERPLLEQTIGMHRCVPTHHEVLDIKPHAPFTQVDYDDARMTTRSGHSVIFTSRIVICKGLLPEDVASALPTENREGRSWTHMSRLLKFVVAREEIEGQKSGIFALGGEVSPILDGICDVDGCENSLAVKNAAVRHAKTQTGIDFSRCRRWTPVIKLHYLTNRDSNDKGGTMELEERVTVMFLLEDAYMAIPGWVETTVDMGKWMRSWEDRHALRKSTLLTTMREVEKEEGEYEIKQVPPDPSLLFLGVKSSNYKFKSLPISLDGILDYNDQDTSIGTFELSMLAESLHEIICRDAAGTILRSVMKATRTIHAGLLAKQGADDPYDADQNTILTAFGYLDTKGSGNVDLQYLHSALSRLCRAIHPGTLWKMLTALSNKTGQTSTLSYQRLF